MLLAVAIDADLDAGFFGYPHHGFLGRVQRVTAGAAELGGVHVVGPERLAQGFGLVAAHADPVLLGDGIAIVTLLFIEAVAKAHHVLDPFPVLGGGLAVAVGAGDRCQVVGIGRLTMLAMHPLGLLLVAVGAGLVGAAQERHLMRLGQGRRRARRLGSLALQAGQQHGRHQHQS
ncbi:hypothetical protein D3C80_1636650 [compost metagenome]